jgi:5'-nucleotidase (lipoprotein e(P4) family)
MKTILLALLACSSLACCTTTAVSPATPQCNPGHTILNPALWMQSSAEYRAIALQTYANARRALDAGLAESPGGLPPAIILDLDETSLDNTPFEARMIRSGQTYNEAAWKRWTAEGAAPAIPGAAEFLKYAQSRGVRPFYITNRDMDEEPGTRRNLETLGFPLEAGVDTLLQRGENGWTTSDKTARRQYVAQAHRVLLLLGDDLNDFVDARDKSHAEREQLLAANAKEWGTRWFILPNAMYGSWERAAIGPGGTPCEQVQRKVDAMR